MHKFIKKIKSHEEKPEIINNFMSLKEIEKIQQLYQDLPVEIDNKRQKILKKKWSKKFNPALQNLYLKKLSSNLQNFELDNPVTKDGEESLGFSFWAISVLGLTVLSIPMIVIETQGDVFCFLQLWIAKIIGNDCRQKL